MTLPRRLVALRRTDGERVEGTPGSRGIGGAFESHGEDGGWTWRSGVDPTSDFGGVGAVLTMELSRY